MNTQEKIDFILNEKNKEIFMKYSSIVGYGQAEYINYDNVITQLKREEFINFVNSLQNNLGYFLRYEYLGKFSFDNIEKIYNDNKDTIKKILFLSEYHRYFNFETFETTHDKTVNLESIKECEENIKKIYNFDLKYTEFKKVVKVKLGKKETLELKSDVDKISDAIPNDKKHLNIFNTILSGMFLQEINLKL